MSVAVLELDALDLVLAALLLLLNAGIAFGLRLPLGRKILTATVRATLQLLGVGFLLAWVFRADGPVLVLAVMLGMALLAGTEAVRRSSVRVRGLAPLALGVLLVSSFTVTLYGTQLVLSVSPWYAPQYLIPILGMVLGNALNGIALGTDVALRGYREQRHRIELLLAHGATPWEASRDVVREALRTGMIPILNSMAAAGVISIPGMMTGQMLAGEDPSTAARYQLFILFCIAGGVALGTLGVVVGSVRLVFDERQRLRTDWLRPADASRPT